MDINDFRGLVTGVLLLSYIGLCIWAYSSKRKAHFDNAANLPFADDEMDKMKAPENTKNV